MMGIGMIAYLVGGEFCHKIQSFVGREKGGIASMTIVLELHMFKPSLKLKISFAKKRKK